MKRRASTLVDGRTDSEVLEGTRVKYTHRACGRSHIIDHSKGPISKRLTPTGVRLLSRYWYPRRTIAEWLSRVSR